LARQKATVRWLLIALVLSAFSCKSGGSAGFLQPGWKPVETFQFDWNDDGVPDTFVLENPADIEEPGSIKRLRVRLSGQPDFTLETEEAWVKYSAGANDGNGSFAQQNLVNSQYALLLPMATHSKKRALLFLTGQAVGNTPGRLQVLQIDDDGTPKVIFYDEQFDLVDFTDLDGDGYPEIVGKPCFEQSREDGTETYAPFQAYKTPRDGSPKAIMSTGMSATYNRLHYYGWAGPECSEEWVIVKNPPAGGNPLIMKASDVAKFMQGGKPPAEGSTEPAAAPVPTPAPPPKPDPDKGPDKN